MLSYKVKGKIKAKYIALSEEPHKHIKAPVLQNLQRSLFLLKNVKNLATESLRISSLNARKQEKNGYKVLSAIPLKYLLVNMKEDLFCGQQLIAEFINKSLTS